MHICPPMRFVEGLKSQEQYIAQHGTCCEVPASLKSPAKFPLIQAEPGLPISSQEVSCAENCELSALQKNEYHQPFSLHSLFL